MLENNKHIVNPEELDHLLNQAFLELDFNNPKNDTIMETISNQVMNTNLYAALQKSNKQTLKQFFKGYKLWISLALIIITSILVYINFFEKDKKGTKPSLSMQNRVSENPEVMNVMQMPVDEIKRVTKHKGLVPNPDSKAVDLIVLDHDTSSIENGTITFQKPKETGTVMDVQQEDPGYAFPVLSEKEIKETLKQKKKMMEQLAKLRKEKYVPIPMGSFKYRGELISLQSFYMQNAEVTNFEYRTFLYDLLIQNKKEEFMLAKPDQSQWMKALGNRPFFKPMEDNYFVHPAYNDYPVVNVSRKGAEMYCTWLTQLVNNYLKEKGKPLMNDLRIPTDFEWTYAAQGNLNGDYPWGSGFTKSKGGKGCYYMNFNIRKEKIDSLEFAECNKKPYFKAFTSGGLMLGEGTTTVNVYAYNPNGFMLYCTSGNVAEMVNVANPLTPQQYTAGTKGGGWNSDAEHVKLSGEDEYKGKAESLPFIGFRPVFTVLKK